MTTARVVGRAMTERQLQDAVMALLRLLGYRTFHAWTSIHSGAGFPDICAVRDTPPARLLFIELKTARGPVKLAQAEWLGLLRGVAGVETYLWRPDDWHSGLIERILR